MRRSLFFLFTLSDARNKPSIRLATSSMRRERTRWVDSIQCDSGSEAGCWTDWLVTPHQFLDIVHKRLL